MLANFYKKIIMLFMKDYTLSKEQIRILRRAHKRERNKGNADRIKAIYSLAVGYSISQVADILMVDQSTLRNYHASYTSGGILELLKAKYHGSECRLSEAQLS